MLMLSALLDLYSLVVLVAVVSSWMQFDPRNPIVAGVRGMTDPVLQPIRQLMPQMGGLDFSPMVLLLLLRMLRGIF
jgi:YggT family protein